MNIPTYYEGFVKDVSIDNDLVTMWLSNDRNGDLYNIYYYGEIADGSYAPELIVAKSVKSDDEIVLFDGAVHGYDNMTWQSHEGDLSNRKLFKFDSQPVKVKIVAEYSIDFDDEKDFWEFIDENHVLSDHGRTISWDELKRNAISWLTITLIDNNGEESTIVDVELA